MYSALYYPVLRAKAGEIDALGHLSPRTLTRIRPLLDLPRLAADSSKALDDYLAECAASIARSWGGRYPLYLDMSVYGPDVTVGSQSAVERLFGHARQHRLLAIPVAGPIATRGPGPRYLEAVARIAQADRRGAALRFHYSDYVVARTFLPLVMETLRLLQLTPDQVDLYLDNEAIDLSKDQPCTQGQLLLDLSAAIRAVSQLAFRTIVVCGSGLPRAVPKRKDNDCVRIERPDWPLWRSSVRAFGAVLPRFADYGVVYPHEADSVGAVRPPARIRLSTPDAHYLWRAKSANYSSLARNVIGDPAFRHRADSWGASEVEACAAGRGGPGRPQDWVARDTNHHIEVMADAVESYLREIGHLGMLEFAPPQREAWLQNVLMA